MHLRCARTLSTDATYALCTCCRLCRGQIGSPATLRALYGCIFLLHRLHKRPAPERRRNKSFDAPVATHPGAHSAPESHWPSSLIMHAVHPLTLRREAHCQIPLQSSRPDAVPVFVFPPPPLVLLLSLRSCVQPAAAHWLALLRLRSSVLIPAGLELVRRSLLPVRVSRSSVSDSVSPSLCVFAFR